MQIFRPRQCSPKDMKVFHADDYVDFLERITPENQVWKLKQEDLALEVKLWALWYGDTPWAPQAKVFSSLSTHWSFPFCRMSTFARWSDFKLVKIAQSFQVSFPIARLAFLLFADSQSEACQPNVAFPSKGKTHGVLAHRSLLHFLLINMD